jgi:hypothetical protein
MAKKSIFKLSPIRFIVILLFFKAKIYELCLPQTPLPFNNTFNESNSFYDEQKKSTFNFSAMTIIENQVDSRCESSGKPDSPNTNSFVCFHNGKCMKKNSPINNTHYKISYYCLCQKVKGFLLSCFKKNMHVFRNIYVK